MNTQGFSRMSSDGAWQPSGTTLKQEMQAYAKDLKYIEELLHGDTGASNLPHQLGIYGCLDELQTAEETDAVTLLSWTQFAVYGLHELVKYHLGQQTHPELPPEPTSWQAAQYALAHSGWTSATLLGPSEYDCEIGGQLLGDRFEGKGPYGLPPLFVQLDQLLKETARLPGMPDFRKEAGLDPFLTTWVMPPELAQTACFLLQKSEQAQQFQAGLWNGLQWLMGHDLCSAPIAGAHPDMSNAYFEGLDQYFLFPQKSKRI